MTAEIISVGTELLLGNILNTNAQYLSRELAALGITVQRESTIGDNHGRLADFVNEAKQRCDLLVFTGGLGPTADDLTKETVAGCYGDTLAFDPEEWQKIVDFFTRTGRKTTPNNRKQAMVPVNGHKITNNHGTAPGAWFEQDGHCAVLMPGVPHEMKAMWEESVRPLLLARQNCTLHSIMLRVLGGESDIEYRVRHLLENANPTAAIYCKTGECEIRITARAETDSSAEKMCRAYATKFYDLLGDAVYDEDVTGLEETLVHTLKKKGLTIATAESCTGGMIAQRLTNVSGASEVFGFGFVTYWEQAKAKMIGVDPARSQSTMWCPHRWQHRWHWAQPKLPGPISLSASPVWPAPTAAMPSARWARCIWARPGGDGVSEKAVRLPARPCIGACPRRAGRPGAGPAAGTGKSSRRHRAPCPGRTAQRRSAGQAERGVPGPLKGRGNAG